MIFWIALIGLSLAGLAFAAWPLFRGAKSLTPLVAGVILFTVGLSAGLYSYLGSPDVPSGAGTALDADEMVTALAARLEDNPDDVRGWIMLGRSYQNLQQFDAAIRAFEKALELEQGQNAQTMVALAIALMGQRDGEVSDRAVSLFENALALEPNNATALFYSGGAAARRGNTTLAAERWELLLSLDAPDEIRGLLQARIDEWRGVEPAPLELPGSIVAVNIELAGEAAEALAGDATVFVIARDAAQPSPPIAVVRRRLSELPATVELSDRDAMIPGRPLSGFQAFEVVARVSLSGQPAEQSGDWSGSVIWSGPEPGSSANPPAVNLIIDQKTP